MNTTEHPSKKKLGLFYAVTFSLPIIIILVLELSLRIFGYRSDYQNLFIDVPGQEDYLIVNADYVGRYFPNFVPKIAGQAFQKEKGKNTFRVFVLGGSSTQGFPYNFYNSFSGRIEQKLLMHTTDMTIEVINLGMTAVNSYVIWDLKDQIKDYEPDAVIIYAGHNEYYGSFGVGSSQFGLGKSVGLKRTIIKLKNLRLYQLIEQILKPEDQNEGNRTMMARVVSESQINYGDDLFQAGIDQFTDNISETVEVLRGEGIPIFIGTLASNLKGQDPLGENPIAIQSFEKAKAFEAAGEIDSATFYYTLSKDYDEIRFRAPSEMNNAIRSIASDYELSLVDIAQLSVDSSASGIPDDTFFDDHLHPNGIGNQMIGEAFYEALTVLPGLSDKIVDNKLSKRMKVSQFEQSTAVVPVMRLESGYPFTKGLTPERELQIFDQKMNQQIQKSFIDSVAAVTWRYQRKVTLSLTDIINDATRKRDSLTVMDHYLNLAHLQVFNESLLKKGVAYAMDNRQLDHHTAHLLEFIINKDRDDPYYSNSLSALYLLNNDLDNAQFWLNVAEEEDPQNEIILYNQARLKAMQFDTLGAMDYFRKYQEARQAQN